MLLLQPPISLHDQKKCTSRPKMAKLVSLTLFFTTSPFRKCVKAGRVSSSSSSQEDLELLLCAHISDARYRKMSHVDALLLHVCERGLSVKGFRKSRRRRQPAAVGRFSSSFLRNGPRPQTLPSTFIKMNWRLYLLWRTATTSSGKPGRQETKCGTGLQET